MSPLARARLRRFGVLAGVEHWGDLSGKPRRVSILIEVDTTAWDRALEHALTAPIEQRPVVASCFHFETTPPDQVITDEMREQDEAALDALAQQLEAPPTDESWLHVEPVSGRRRGRHRR